MAKRFMRLTTLINISTVVIIQILIFFSRDAVARFFTSDPEVQEITSNVLILFSIIFFFDGFQIFLQGPIRACELHNKATCITVILYYGIALPLAIYLSISKGMGNIGMQIGVGTAIFLQFLSFIFLLYQSDW